MVVNVTMDHNGMIFFFMVVMVTSRPALANVLVVKGQGRNMPLCSLQSPSYGPDSHLTLACSLLLLSLCSCSSDGLDILGHPPAVGGSQLPVLIPAPSQLSSSSQIDPSVQKHKAYEDCFPAHLVR